MDRRIPLFSEHHDSRRISEIRFRCNQEGGEENNQKEEAEY